MSIFKRLVAAILPEQKPPSKLPSKPQAAPRYLGTAKGTKLGNNATNITNIDRSTFSRNAGTMNDVVANLVRSSPDLSHAVATKISTSISKNYTVVAYDEVGRVDVKGTEAAQALCLRWDSQAHDYSRFTRSTDIRSLCASLILDSARYGGMTAELVLGAGRVPSHIRAIDTAKIEWADNMLDSYPIYKARTGDVELNYPTIFYSATQQDMATPYSESPLSTAIQPALYDAELFDHLRRAAHRTLLQRLIVTIDSDKWLEQQSPEVRYDADKLAEKMAATVSQIETQMANLEPEDSLVIFSSLGIDTTQDANRSEDRTLQVLNTLISGQLASGSKILPSVIGRAPEGSSAASTEAMLFLKSISAIQNELNIFLSRILTLAVKLLGNEVSVRFEFEDVNLRPEIELESFRVIRQSRLVKELSLGMRSDVEVSILLTGSLPPQGYKELSGTMFDKSTGLETSGNNYSNTSAADTGQTDSSKSTKDSQADEKGVPGKNKK
jgi:hypothetical protein